MVRIQQSLWDRVEPSMNAIALMVIAGVCAALIYYRAVHPGYASAFEECRRAYGRARTATDTAAIDARHPVSGNAKDPNAPTCGTLRRMGGRQ